MMIQGSANIAAAGLSRAYQAQQLQTQTHSPAQAPQKDDFARRFDSVTISGESGPAAELKSRLTQEVRTASSGESIEALREQIRSGTYRIDAREIARKMLLTGGIG